jgi:hypothetical protein
MRIIYLTFLSIISFISNAQWAGYNGNGGDNLWSNDANWAFPNGVTELATGQRIDFYVNPETVTLDEVYTAKGLKIVAGKANNFTVTGDNTLTIDIADADQGNVNSGTFAIESASTSATTLTLDCNVTIANSVTPAQYKGVSVVSTARENTAENIIKFAAGKTLTLAGTSTTSFHGAGEVHIEGNLVGTQGILLGSNANVTIGSSSSDLSGYTGDITVASGTELTIKSNGTTKILNSKIQVNGVGNPKLTLESQDVFTPIEIRVSTKDNQTNRTLDIHCKENQAFRTIRFKGADNQLNLIIDPNVTSITFYANNNEAYWSTGSKLNIIGYKQGVIKFGNGNSSLNNGSLLDRILIDGAAPASPLSLDVNGNLIGGTLSSDGINGFEFSIYPNPVNDVVRFTYGRSIISAKAYDIMGKEVIRKNNPNNSINTSSLVSGLYLLKLESEDGQIATRKFVKQ